MKSLHYFGVGIVTALLCGCTGTSSPVEPLAMSGKAGDATKCASQRGTNLTVCVRVPRAGITVSIADTIYGDPKAIVGKHSCAPSRGPRLCVASFSAPDKTLNQIEVDASGPTTASGAFPIYVGTGSTVASAVLESSKPTPIATLAVVPFHSTTIGTESTLPLGQKEPVWIVASDSANEIIIGNFVDPITIATSSNAVATPKKLASTGDAEKLTFGWKNTFVGGSGSSSGTLTASTSQLTTTSLIEAASGVIYYRVGADRPTLGPGPVALSPDGAYVYFVVNDDSYGGCRSPGACKGVLGRFSTRTFTKDPPVALTSVPGVSQLYVTSDGALWMATFQPVGIWNHPLPGLRMPPSEFGSSDLQTLPATFGEPSGFTADSYENLWISTCKGKNCKQDQRGTPLLVKTSIAGSQTPEATVELPTSCMQVGYFGYSVGDVAYYQGQLYVLGINDGSAPPARGNIWRVSPSTLYVTCTHVPGNFNPSPQFSLLSNTAGAPVLILGAGGNDANFRWQPNHGFYVVNRVGSTDMVTWDGGPGVTANHIAASPPPSAGSGNVLYFASSGKLDLRFSGLGTYQSSADPGSSPSPWSIFPSASFSGDESDNGVAASSDGAWYTASGVCGDWKGVCLAHAIYLDRWGVLPQLSLAPLATGNTAGFGVITNPLGSTGIKPLHGHAGPGYYAHGSSNGTCSVQQDTALTFGVVGLNRGVCQITVNYYDGKKVTATEALVTDITSSPPAPLR